MVAYSVFHHDQKHIGFEHELDFAGQNIKELFSEPPLLTSTFNYPLTCLYRETVYLIMSISPTTHCGYAISPHCYPQRDHLSSVVLLWSRKRKGLHGTIVAGCLAPPHRFHLNTITTTWQYLLAPQCGNKPMMLDSIAFKSRWNSGNARSGGVCGEETCYVKAIGEFLHFFSMTTTIFMATNRLRKCLLQHCTTGLLSERLVY